MHGITTQIIQLPKLKVFLLLPRLDNKQQVQVLETKLSKIVKNGQFWYVLGYQETYIYSKIKKLLVKHLHHIHNINLKQLPVISCT